MRFNEKEVICFSAEPGDKEGRLFYKGPGFREVYKERWFKLKGNLLYYFRLNEHGAVYESEPVGVIVVEQCRIQPELYTEISNAFSITFANDLEKRHYFGCQTKKQCEEWMSVLKVCSYEYQRTRLKELQTLLCQRTGVDPLAAFSKMNEKDIEETDSDSYFNRVHLFSKVKSDFTNHL